MAFNPGQDNLEPVGPPQESAADIAGAAWENMSLTGTFMESVTDGWKREGLGEIGVPQKPEVTNKMFPGLNADRDITLSEAKFIMDKRKKVQDNQKIIDSASDSFLKGTALPFVAGAARAMVDPIDMGINMITGGLGTGLKAGASVARKVGIDAAEAAIAATIAEIPVAKEMTQSFEDYTATNFLTNVIGASVLQVGLMHGAPAAFHGTAKTLDFMGAKTADNLVKLADTLESRGVNSTKSIDFLVNKLNDMTSKHADITLSMKKNFGDKIESSGNMVDDLQTVMKAHEDGLIDDIELTTFKDDAIAAGVDERVLKQAVDNEGGIVFRDEEIQQAKEVNNDPKNKQGFNQEAEDTLKSLDDFDPDTMIDQQIAVKSESDPKLSLESEDGTVSLNDVRTKRDTDIQEQNFLREFAACKRGL